ncbi:unnamed protein product, partial [Choristocarpus tenellus]
RWWKGYPNLPATTETYFIPTNLYHKHCQTSSRYEQLHKVSSDSQVDKTIRCWVHLKVGEQMFYIQLRNLPGFIRGSTVKGGWHNYRDMGCDRDSLLLELE